MMWLAWLLACAMPPAVLADPPSQRGDEQVERPVVAPTPEADGAAEPEPERGSDSEAEAQAESEGGALPPPDPTAAPITDDDAIIAMVQERLASGVAELSACDVGSPGRWELHFTVTKAGPTGDVDIKPVGASNAEVENCLFDHVQGWRFESIKADLPVKKTVTFAG